MTPTKTAAPLIALFLLGFLSRWLFDELRRRRAEGRWPWSRSKVAASWRWERK